MKTLTQVVLLSGVSTLVDALPSTGLITPRVPPADFTANPNVGPGGSRWKDSPHFRIYGATSDAVADRTIAMLEAAYTCFVDDLGWRSPGLSFRQDHDNGPWHKLNVYQLETLPGAAANTPTDLNLGLAWLNVVKTWMTEPGVVVHEFGHALTYSARWWIDQYRTGAWWETVANFVADTYLTSPHCAPARAKYNQPEGNTIIELKKVIGDSFQVIVDGTANTANHYQAFPFLTYLHNNPDQIQGLGTSIFPGVWTQYKRYSDETPLHVLERLIAPGGTKIQAVVGKYWARMAFVDINHPQAQAIWRSQRSQIIYANLDSQGNGQYRVKSARRPRYMGANIIPLKTNGAVNVSVTITISGAGRLTSTLAVRQASGAVRYVELVKGSGNVAVGNGEEVMLVVVNTPANLVLFDPFKLTAETNTGVDYTVQIIGATI
ncbi:hypothetical protein B0T21DRAFT_286247 [Apiosordaria backusii]|uniref:Dockerin type 1 n=1 Tax=Apiosordaria backusii TaxID=314023 RepID=A0AA40BN15_9PEZI|nr:hypothetical protein B0T21DRAFT_286247 [Apiosordaria backusii]